VHRNARQIAEAIHSIESEKGRDATDREVAEMLGTSLDEYFTAMQDAMSCRLFSLDELTGDDEFQLDGGGSPFEGVQEAAFQGFLAQQIEHLPDAACGQTHEAAKFVEVAQLGQLAQTRHRK